MDYKLLGKRIRAARLAAGMSQEQLAEMVGLTSQHISHTEQKLLLQKSAYLHL